MFYCVVYVETRQQGPVRVVVIRFPITVEQTRFFQGGVGQSLGI